MPDKKKVHVVDRNGKPVYNRLWDDGTDVLRFESGNGFVKRSEMVWGRDCKVVDGWKVE